MRLNNCLALAVLCAACDAALFSCDDSKRTIKKDVITIPCSISFQVFGQTVWKQEFFIDTKECSNGFRLYGKIAGNDFDRSITEEDNEIELPTMQIPGINCRTIKFNDIMTSEDGVSFCPTFACKFMKDPKCVSLHVADSCMSKTSCSECTSSSSCGWCYDSERCLPKSSNSDNDRCGYCEDWTSDQCPECPDNCGGHGTCNMRTCTCDQYWTGTDTCNVYNPPEDLCETVPIERVPLSLHDGSYSDGMYHAVVHVEGRLSYFAVESSDPNIMVYIRARSRVYPFKYDYRTGETEAAACIKSKAGTTIIVSKVNPAMAANSDIWIGVEAEKGPSSVTLQAVIGVCSKGMTGWPCDTPVTDVDLLNDEAVTTEQREGSRTLLTLTRTIGVMTGKSHFVGFPIPSETEGIDVTVSGDLKEYVKLVQYHEGAEVGPHVAMASTTDAGVLVTLDDSYMKSWAEVPVTIKAMRCETKNDQYGDCGAEPHVMNANDNSIEVEWMPGAEWVVIRLTVPSGVNNVEVRAATGVVGTAMYASYRVRPNRKSEIVTREGVLELTHAEPGYWFVGLYKGGGVTEEETATFDVTMMKCLECDAEHCDDSYAKVLVTECSEVGCADTTASYSLSQCVQIDVASSDSPSPHTEAPVPVIIPVQQPTPADKTRRHGRPRLFVVALLGGVIAVCFIIVGIVLAYFFSKWRVRQEKARRERGGYDFAPNLADLEMDSDDEAQHQGDASDAKHTTGTVNTASVSTGPGVEQE